MLPRLLVLGAVMLLAGCGGTGTTTAPAPAPQAEKLPPEVEHDPATAAQKYQKAKKTRP